IAQGWSRHTYTYRPALVTTTEPVCAGFSAPVDQEPSSAAIVCTSLPLFSQVTRVPVFTRARYGLNAYSSVVKRAPVSPVSRASDTISISLVSLIGPVNRSSSTGGRVDGRCGNVPPSLNAQTFLPAATATYCSPPISYEATGPPPAIPPV